MFRWIGGVGEIMRLTRVKLSAVLIGLGLFSSVLCALGARGDETTAGGGARRRRVMVVVRSLRL